MSLDQKEQDQRRRYEEHYPLSQDPAMRSIEERVCGCDYGASSWTTRGEAEQLAACLDLRPGVRLLDIGAGAGWPALYWAKTTGCDIALTDLPLGGLRVAADRARREPSSGACWIAVADGAHLPFGDETFDAVSHNDALCCLRAKREVLGECGRVIRENGRMAFTVIYVAPGLTGESYRRAVESGPEFIEAEADYPTLLSQTGWSLRERVDLTLAYADTCQAMLQAFQQSECELTTLFGGAAYADRRAKLTAALGAIRAGLQRRELMMATPAG